jgi:hypothetical protein
MAAQTYNVLFKNGRSTQVAGVLSITVVHEENYDNANYRDDMDLTLVPVSSLTIAGAPYNIAALTASAAPTNAPTGDLSDGILQTGNNYYSVSDKAAKIPPRNESKKRSRFKFWSLAAGAGDELFSAWCDRVDGYSIGTYSRV